MRRIPKRVMIVSFDAVGRKDISFMETLPTFATFFKKAALCDHVKSVYPSLTYPAHASIVTGRMPKNHGVINNTLLQPKRERADWMFKRSYIRGTTLYDQALAQGKTVAALLWPTIGRSKIQYYVPEIMATRKWQSQILVNAFNGPPVYQLELNRLFGHLRDGIRQPALDNFIQASAIHTIYRYRPDLLLLHLSDVDTNRHLYGVTHPRVEAALVRHDQRLREIMTALSETGDMDDTTVVILGDHYQKDVRHIVYPNEILRQEGLLEWKRGEIVRFQAVAKTCDGSCYIYLKGGPLAPTERKESIWRLFQDLQQKPEYGIAKIMDSKEAAGLGADPNCFLMLEAKEEYCFLDECGQVFKEVEEEKKHKVHGVHGYLPDSEDYGTFFAATGCGIRPGKITREIALWDEGVTLATLMGLSLGKTDGTIIEEMLE